MFYCFLINFEKNVHLGKIFKPLLATVVIYQLINLLWLTLDNFTHERELRESRPVKG